MNDAEMPGDDTELEARDEVHVTNSPFEIDADEWNPAMLYAKFLMEGSAGQEAREAFPDQRFRVIVLVENLDVEEDRGGGFAGVATPEDAIEFLIRGAQEIAIRHGHAINVTRNTLHE